MNSASPSGSETAVVASTGLEPSSILGLWPDFPAGTAGEIAEDFGTGGRRDRHIKNVLNPRLEVFLPRNADPNRPACIICPGGGYGFLAADKEGNEIARMFNQNGVAAFVLIYRLPDGSMCRPGAVPAPIQDVQRAIRIVRADAGRWNIDPNRIGIMGFSAGGHVASAAATLFDSGDPAGADPVMRQSSRPDFAVLIYPVISMHDPFAHVGSRDNLLGAKPSTDWMNRCSAHMNMTAEVPPLFIVHAEDDAAVPVENSLHMTEAARRHGVPCELVLFKIGGHGFGLGQAGSEAAVWPQRLVEWMRATGVLSSQT